MLGHRLFLKPSTRRMTALSRYLSLMPSQPTSGAGSNDKHESFDSDVVSDEDNDAVSAAAIAATSAVTPKTITRPKITWPKTVIHL